MTMKKKKLEQSVAPTDNDLESWVTEAPSPYGCRTCGNVGAATSLRRLLQAMVRSGNHSITLHKLHTKLRNLHEDYRVGFWGFRDHLYNCEKALYEESKRARSHA